MKRFSVIAELNDLLVKNRVQCVTVAAGNIGLAAKRGWEAIKKRDGVKGKRIKKAKFSIVMVEEQQEENAEHRSTSC